MANLHKPTVDGFGEEWSRFDQSILSAQEATFLFEQYFSLFPWAELPPNAVGIDVGCGSGRWAKHVAPRVGRLHCIDASDEALAVSRGNLADSVNCEFHHCSVDELPFEANSMDFGYSLGVLHHIPDIAAAIRACVQVLKPSAPFLLYLYYRFDNRPSWFRRLWQLSDPIRQLVSRLPMKWRHFVTDAIAVFAYLPLAHFANYVERTGIDVTNFPLSAYRNSSFYTMRTDSLDRFGTRLEQRFTRIEITEMMVKAGLESVVFRDDVPFWCALGKKRAC